MGIGSSRVFTLVTAGTNRNRIIIDANPIRIFLTLRWDLFSFIAHTIFIICVANGADKDETSVGKTTHPYLTANAIVVAQKLNEPFTESFDQLPLGYMLRLVSLKFELPIWCDRRIAIDKPIIVRERLNTLNDFLNTVSSEVGAAIAVVDRMVLVVPAARRDAIELSYWRLTQSAEFARLNRIDKRVWEWPDGSVAEKLLADFAGRYQLPLASNIEVEHDLWGRWEFREITPAAISVCLLSGFELGLTEEGGQLSAVPLVPSTESCRVDWTYNGTEIEKIGKESWKNWRERWPDGVVEKVVQDRTTTNKQWRVSATPSAHRDLVRSLVPNKKLPSVPRASPDQNTKKLYSGKFQSSLGNVLSALASQGKLEFTPWPLSEADAAKAIDLELDQLTIDEVLMAISAQSGIQFQRQGAIVRVVSAEK